MLGNSIGLKGININTLQSDLGLRLNFDVEKFDINKAPFDPKGKIKIGNYLWNKTEIWNRWCSIK